MDFIKTAKKEEKLHDFQSKIEAIAILWRDFTEGKQVILTFSNMMFSMQWS